MFAKIIKEWRSVHEGYKGTWHAGGEDNPWNEPDEDPEKPRAIPNADLFKKKLQMRSKPTMAGQQIKPQPGVMSKPASPPPIPNLPRKGPPPLPRK